MNKKEIIEDMKKTLVDWAIKNDLCFSFEIMQKHAEALYIAGYRKIQEGSVVVSKNEYEELNITGKYFNDALKQARKETVKEILFKVESAFAYFDNEDMFSKKAILRRVKEATNQYPVEV